MFFQPKKGVIALDVDGTLTAEADAIDIRVVDALHALSREWNMIFITGRPFQWGYRTLQSLPFFYALAVQNGALLLELPSKEILSRKYLTKEIIPKLELICQKQKTDFIIYSGFENDDWCYYRPAHLPPSLLSYILKRTSHLSEKWQPLQTFSQLPVDEFSSIKFFARKDQAFVLSQEIESELGLHAPPNRDPFDPEYFVIQATHAEATKGHVLREFIRLIGITGPIIAAGDDYNDFTMLQMADIKIVMSNAPHDLLAMADIIALPADQQGIIQGLAAAVVRLTHGKEGSHV